MIAKVRELFAEVSLDSVVQHTSSLHAALLFQLDKLIIELYLHQHDVFGSRITW